MNNQEQVNNLIKEYTLSPDDVYIDNIKKFKIVRRKGYKKIQSKLNIIIEFGLSHSSPDSAVVIARSPSHKKRETFGEASPKNNTFPYPVAVAQKRAEGRLILEVSGLYQKGFITEDEIDEKVEGEKIIKLQEKKVKEAIDNVLDNMSLSSKKKLRRYCVNGHNTNKECGNVGICELCK